MTLTKRVPPPSRTGGVCNLGRLLGRLDSDEANALRGMLADDAWDTTAITEALVEEGYEIGYSTVRRHRKGGCACAQRGLT